MLLAANLFSIFAFHFGEFMSGEVSLESANQSCKVVAFLNK